MTTDITDAQIESLRNHAGEAGDALMVAICYLALDEDVPEYVVSQLDAGEYGALLTARPGAARAECERVIAEAQG